MSIWTTICGCGALGFQLGRHGQVLPQFVAYLQASGATTVTVELAVAWARLPQRIKPITADFRLSAVRGFARSWAFGPCAPSNTIDNRQLRAPRRAVETDFS